MRERDIERLREEYEDTVKRINAYQREVNEMRDLCMQLSELIDGHKIEMNFTNGKKVSLRDQFENLQRKYTFTVN